MKGSYTVEAALLMGILLPLLTGLLGTGIYIKSRAEVYGEALEKACERALTEGNQEGSIEESVSRQVPILPMAKVFFQWPEEVTGNCTLEQRNPVKTIFRLHSLKKVVRQVTE